MNSVILIGNLTADPVTRQTASGPVCNFAIAVNRPTRNGESAADFPRIVVFGKQAENCARFLSKGRKVGIEGEIRTGSYKDRDGRTVYTTDVVAHRVEFLTPAPRRDDRQPAPEDQGGYTAYYQESLQEEYPGFFAASEDNIPF